MKKIQKKEHQEFKIDNIYLEFEAVRLIEKIQKHKIKQIAKLHRQQ